MPAPLQPRVPFAPLAARIRAEDDSAMARTLGVSRYCIMRWKKTDVPVNRADQLAVSLGAHPSEIWPEWFA